jgi:hypothetical protein
MVSWSHGSLRDLGHLPGTDCYATDVNDHGDVVGWARTYAMPPYVAVVKLAGQEVVDLNSLLPPLSGWTLARAHGISADGAIVGTGIVDGFYEPFLMTPTRVALSAPRPGRAGVRNSFEARNATAMAPVWYFVSVSAGETPVPGCVQGLDLGAPLYFGFAESDAGGRAVLTVNVPGWLSQRQLLLQAYDITGCATSNVIEHTF